MTEQGTMTERWTVFDRDRGQIVEYAYRYHLRDDTVYQRVTDTSRPKHDPERVAYYRAPCPDECEWGGGEGGVPMPADTDWRKCEAPW